jgi:putative transposase
MPNNDERYRRRSIRLLGYDYRSTGMYFITICTEGRATVFGEVVNGEMVLSDLGKVAWEEWQRSADVRREITLDAFVVMPNHIHGIVAINREDTTVSPVSRHGVRPTPLVIRAVSDSNARPVPRSRAGGSLGSLVAGFKATVTRRINELRDTPGERVWQRNYYEHIVRNNTDLARIREYIVTNPLHWHLDRENPSRTGDDPFDIWSIALLSNPS